MLQNYLIVTGYFTGNLDFFFFFFFCQDFLFVCIVVSFWPKSITCDDFMIVWLFHALDLRALAMGMKRTPASLWLPQMHLVCHDSSSTQSLGFSAVCSFSGQLH